MESTASRKKVLVMGVGNTLLQDDGIGVHVTETLKASQLSPAGIDYLDGGTIGLSLLPEIEEADAVVIVDASEIGETPGAMRIFRNAEIDQQLSGRKKTVHEVALADLFSAAAIRGRCPSERALVAIQPGSTDWGLEPTADVQATIPRACEAISKLTREWLHEA
jgi:hydrogenase maturation protease